MRGVHARIAPQYGRQHVRGRRLVGTDRSTQAGRVVRRQQLPQRHLHEIRITKVFVAIAEGAAHRFDDVVVALRGVHLVQIVATENIEHLADRHAAGRGRRRRDHAPVAVVDDNRFAFLDLIARKILGDPVTAGSAYRFDQLLCDGTFVERIGTIGGNALQRACQLGLLEGPACLRNLAARQQNGGGRGIAGDHLAAPIEFSQEARVRLIAVARMRDGRRQGGFQRQLAVVLGDPGETGRFARNAG